MEKKGVFKIKHEYSKQDYDTDNLEQGEL